MDGLTGFPDAVKAVFPNTHIQHCIVHMIRNSTRFVSYKDLKAVCRDLKEIYSAINAESGHEALEEFGKKWNNKYPMIQASWERNWNNLTEFFNYPEDIKRGNCSSISSDGISTLYGSHGSKHNEVCAFERHEIFCS